MSEDEKRAQNPDGAPTDDGDVADVTAHSASGLRARAWASPDNDGFIDSRDLHDLAIKWSRIHGPGVLPGAIQSACALTLPANGMYSATRLIFRYAASGSESTAGQACPGAAHAALHGARRITSCRRCFRRLLMARAAGEPGPPAVAQAAREPVRDTGPSSDHCSLKRCSRVILRSSHGNYMRNAYRSPRV